MENEHTLVIAKDMSKFSHIHQTEITRNFHKQIMTKEKLSEEFEQLKKSMKKITLIFWQCRINFEIPKQIFPSFSGI